MKNNPNLVEESYRKGHLWWINRIKGQELEKAAYEELLNTGKVKFIEINPIPEWVNI